MVQALEGADGELDQQRRADGEALLAVDLLPVGDQQSGAQQQVEGHAAVAHVGLHAGGVVALRRDGVAHRQHQGCQLRRAQEALGRQAEAAGRAGLLLHQNGDVLVEEVHHQQHGGDKGTVQQAVDQGRHGVQMVHGVQRGAVENQVHQHRQQQDGEGLVQGRALTPGGKVDVGHEGQDQEQRDLHAQHGAVTSLLGRWVIFSRR